MTNFAHDGELASRAGTDIFTSSSEYVVIDQIASDLSYFNGEDIQKT